MITYRRGRSRPPIPDVDVSEECAGEQGTTMGFSLTRVSTLRAFRGVGITWLKDPKIQNAIRIVFGAACIRERSK